MFSKKNQNFYLADHFDRQYYGAKLKLKKFDADEISYRSKSAINSNFVPEDEPNQSCIKTRNISYYYTASVPILKKIDLNVPKGKIYALLGASGCGKTTLLRIILGRLKPVSGEVKVFDIEPGSSKSDIPGPGVGYMPQDLSLFKSFTISEVLAYYGSLYRMESDSIRQRTNYLVTLLNLPTKHRLVEKLSGGQQRRVSLAVTLIHEPPLLILDEPTVGVDSLLRLRIWNYLEELCRYKETTVVITTHYTEEARNSFRVGFIDSGSMLAEANPQFLLTKYKCKSLEEVFLELCLEKSRKEVEKSFRKHVALEQTEETDVDKPSKKASFMKKLSLKARNRGYNVDANNNANAISRNSVKKPQFQDPAVKLVSSSSSGVYFLIRFWALLKKNYILFKRNPASLILLNLLPMMIMALFFVSLGRDPHHIPISVVNFDNDSSSLSNMFLGLLNNETIIVKHYDNIDDAAESITKLDSKLFIRFPQNFSIHLKSRFSRPERVDDEVAEGSTALVQADHADTVFAIYIYRNFLEAFQKFLVEVGNVMGFNPGFMSSPVKVHELVFGKIENNYTDFMKPGLIIAMSHAMTVLIGCLAFIREKSGGHLERSFVAGVKPAELLFSYLAFYLFAVFSLAILVIILMFFVFNTQCDGSLLEVFAFTSLLSIQGLTLGLFTSVMSSSELACIATVFSFELPLIFTSGVFWPLESIPIIFQSFASWNPFTLPINALRSIMFRGWSVFNNSAVVMGYVSSVTYIGVLILLCFIFFTMMNHV